MAQRKPVLLSVAVAAVMLFGASRAFVAAPPRSVTNGLMAAASATLVPLAANAELPPLEDLPMEEVDPTREFGPKEASFNGISFPMMLGGIAFAISWAVVVVSNITPAKEEDGTYVTYTGAGELPPEGFTNPLYPRLSEDYATDEDLEELNKSKKWPSRRQSPAPPSSESEAEWHSHLRV